MDYSKDGYSKKDQKEMTPEEWKAAGDYFVYGQHTIFYRREGSGENVLLLHGFPTASWDWHRIWKSLTKNHYLLAPDLIGFGFSDKPKRYSYSIKDQADLIESLHQSLQISETHILAHDYGDSVAQELLRRFKEGKLTFKIHSICFLNGGLFPETHHPRLIQKLLMTPLGPLLARLYNKKAFAKSFLPLFGPKTKPSEKEIHNFWSLLEYNEGTMITPKLIKYIKEREENRRHWVKALQETRIPLRLINGPEDPVSGLHMVKRYKELVPNPDVVLLTGIGHYPQFEDPEGVVRSIESFI